MGGMIHAVEAQRATLGAHLPRNACVMTDAFEARGDSGKVDEATGVDRTAKDVFELDV